MKAIFGGHDSKQDTVVWMNCAALTGYQGAGYQNLAVMIRSRVLWSLYIALTRLSRGRIHIFGGQDFM